MVGCFASLVFPFEPQYISHATEKGLLWGQTVHQHFLHQEYNRKHATQVWLGNATAVPLGVPVRDSTLSGHPLLVADRSNTCHLLLLASVASLVLEPS